MHTRNPHRPDRSGAACGNGYGDGRGLEIKLRVAAVADQSSLVNVLRLKQDFDTLIDCTSFDIADCLWVRDNQLSDVDIVRCDFGGLPAPGEYNFRPMGLDLCRRFAGKCGIKFIAGG